MKIFVTGATGYIGGSVAVSLVEAGHEVSGLVRSDAGAAAVRSLGMEPVQGTLDEASVLEAAAQGADVVVNAANADHEASVATFLSALQGSGKTFIHTSGSSIVGTQSAGHRSDDVFDETTTFTPVPARAARVALNERILSHAESGFRPVIVCPSLIYGLGLGAGAHSMQIPWLIATARKHGVAKHYGPGENVWSNVHIDDLVVLYRLALEAAPAGAFYFAENGEASMKDLCVSINRMLGFDGDSAAMSLEDAAADWGEGPAQNTMGSNSRVRAVRARRELSWQPKARSAIEEIENGCYRD